ncbi:MAG: curli production assembly protein CsgG [Comamonadaceae bacterium]|nr:MAG: curli production assembly protein CsgG [Comamonadaceae bacterium]
MPAGSAAQGAAQRAVPQTDAAAPTLKRKIALGRITNETTHGRSLLRDGDGDVLGKQTADLLGKALTQSGAYLVFERPDIGKLQAESALTANRLDLVGVDTLIMGSLTEFGRKTVGQSGFASASKRQVAFAKVDLRLVDVRSGLVYFAASGAGEASTETASTFGFGSQASYDGTLNDHAIRQAVSDAVNRMTNELSARPWTTSILDVRQGRVFLAGGKAQGVVPGMVFSASTDGRRVKSPQTGFEITLPGNEVARMRVESTFGDSETSQGAVAVLTTGSLDGQKHDELVVRYVGAAR